jgi:hypothetical protein
MHQENPGQAQDMSKEEKMAIMLQSMPPEDVMMLREMIDAMMAQEAGGPEGPPPEGGAMVSPQPMMRRGVSQMG